MRAAEAGAHHPLIEGVGLSVVLAKSRLPNPGFGVSG